MATLITLFVVLTALVLGHYASPDQQKAEPTVTAGVCVTFIPPYLFRPIGLNFLRERIYGAGSIEAMLENEIREQREWEEAIAGMDAINEQEIDGETAVIIQQDMTDYWNVEADRINARSQRAYATTNEFDPFI